MNLGIVGALVFAGAGAIFLIKGKGEGESFLSSAGSSDGVGSPTPTSNPITAKKETSQPLPDVVIKGDTYNIPSTNSGGSPNSKKGSVTTSSPNKFLEKIGYQGQSTKDGIVYTKTPVDVKSIFKPNSSPSSPQGFSSMFGGYSSAF
jgi:hypothetical protein